MPLHHHLWQTKFHNFSVCECINLPLYAISMNWNTREMYNLIVILSQKKVKTYKSDMSGKYFQKMLNTDWSNGLVFRSKIILPFAPLINYSLEKSWAARFNIKGTKFSVKYVKTSSYSASYVVLHRYPCKSFFTKFVQYLIFNNAKYLIT